MDGIDGLVASCMAIAIYTSSFVLDISWPLWVLVGSLLGFLLLNWMPAKVFMGDVGSTFLGAVFAGLVLNAPTWDQALALLIVSTPLYADAGSCVLRRLFAGQPIFEAHRLHLFQRLNQAGWSHALISLIYISATATLALVLFFGGLLWLIFVAFLEILIGLWLDITVAAPFPSTPKY